MAERRILSLWFPHLAAEQALRQRRGMGDLIGLAVVGDRNGAQILTSLSPGVAARGLRLGQPLRDALALMPDLVSVPENPALEAGFLTSLRRWMGRFTPWVSEEPPAGLMMDLTGCAHLHGGEAGLMAEVEADCASLGLTVRAGLADTPGAAWALARYAGQGAAPSARSGDAIDQEARATRSRASRRTTWQRIAAGGRAADAAATPTATPTGTIAPRGRLHDTLSGLPIAALRLETDAIDGLTRLGLRRVGDILGLPRAALARRFGAQVLRRLDQALGIEPEPVSPAAAPLHFAARLSFPDPIGLDADIRAAIDRVLPVLCARLKGAGRGVRRLRLQLFRTDGTVPVVEVGLARATYDADRILPLLAMRLDGIDPGFGIDCVRLHAVQTEPLHATQHRGHLDAARDAAGRGGRGGQEVLEDLLGRLGTRLGNEAVIRLFPAESHLPERGVNPVSAMWSEAFQGDWPGADGSRPPRPVQLFPPEPVSGPEAGNPTPPARFRWRRRDLETRVALGPERILPEWWFDHPEWRGGPRDYWRVETTAGERLWLYFAHGGDIPGGWFAQGRFD